MHAGLFSARGNREAKVRIKVAQFVAVVLTALALVPHGAHLLEMPMAWTVTVT